jgi:uncharacterized NAD-dependent epimerase/dehydratase family protein
VTTTEVLERRYAILAEGWIASRHAKTAHGLIRYGRDEVVAVIDSTLAGRRVLDVMPALGRDAPIVGNIGEALALSRRSCSLRTVLATGQTCVDAVVSDFVAGASEQLVLEAAGREPDLILVEGQGSLGHPAYSGVTLGLLHGSCPDCLILCTDASDEEVFDGVPRPAPAHAARLYEEVATLTKPAPVVAVSVNTKGLGDAEAEELVAQVADETGLPAADPFRGTAAPILEAVLGAPKTNVMGF